MLRLTVLGMVRGERETRARSTQKCKHHVHKAISKKEASRHPTALCADKSAWPLPVVTRARPVSTITHIACHAPTPQLLRYNPEKKTTRSPNMHKHNKSHTHARTHTNDKPPHATPARTSAHAVGWNLDVDFVVRLLDEAAQQEHPTCEPN